MDPITRDSEPTAKSRIKFLRRRVIENERGEPYMIRLTLFSCPLFAIFLHKILLSDSDRELHDHPWPFVTFILWGRYTEHVPADQQFIGFDEYGEMITKSIWQWRWWPIWHRAKDCHRIELDIDYAKRCYKPVYTLFIHGPRCREWGFHTPQGWVDQKTYLGDRA